MGEPEVPVANDWESPRIAMGRQVEFYMLPEDLRMFLDFVQERDPVVITLRSSESPEVRPVPDPLTATETMTLWNKALVSSLDRILISYPGREYYRVDASLPVLELVPSRACEWLQRPALLRGRIYGVFDKPAEVHEGWYNSLARWIRKYFTKNPVKQLSGYMGPSALEWFRKGGILLPTFVPPPTPAWMLLVENQDATRKTWP